MNRILSFKKDFFKPPLMPVRFPYCRPQLSQICQIPFYGVIQTIAYRIPWLITKQVCAFCYVGKGVPHISGTKISISGLYVRFLRIHKGNPLFYKLKQLV